MYPILNYHFLLSKSQKKMSNKRLQLFMLSFVFPCRNAGGQLYSGVSVPGTPVISMQMDGPQGLFKPLPTTNFGNQKSRRSSVESFTSTASSDNEKELIVNQVRFWKCIILIYVHGHAWLQNFDGGTTRICSTPGSNLD